VRAWSERRVLLVAGKGGVGRSTVALALARSLAAQGHETLLLEAAIGRPGPSAFAARLERPAGPDAQRMGERLSYARLEPRFGQELFLREVIPVGPLVHAAVHSKALARLLDAGPSLDELGVMHHFLTLAEERRGSVLRYARIVLDLPATGHALALADLPNTILRIAPHGPIADRLRRGQALLHDPHASGAVVVTIPEPLALREATELAAGLRTSQVPIAAFLVNRAPASAVPAGTLDALRAAFGERSVAGRRTLEARALAEARVGALTREVAPVPVFRSPEVIGETESVLRAVEGAVTERSTRSA
jgi:arsenite/tail-anchored protein-transporting ATPase